MPPANPPSYSTILQSLERREEIPISGVISLTNPSNFGFDAGSDLDFENQWLTIATNPRARGGRAEEDVKEEAVAHDDLFEPVKVFIDQLILRKIGEGCEAPDDKGWFPQSRLKRGFKTFKRCELKQMDKTSEAAVLGLRLLQAGGALVLIATVANPASLVFIAGAASVGILVKLGIEQPIKDYRRNLARKQLVDAIKKEVVGEESDREAKKAGRSALQGIDLAKAVCRVWWKHTAKHPYFSAWFVSPAFYERLGKQIKRPFDWIWEKLAGQAAPDPRLGAATIISMIGESLRPTLDEKNTGTSYASFFPRKFDIVASTATPTRALRSYWESLKLFKELRGKRLEPDKLLGPEAFKETVAGLRTDKEADLLFSSLLSFGKESGYNHRQGLLKVVYYTATLADFAHAWRQELENLRLSWDFDKEALIQKAAAQLIDIPNHANCAEGGCQLSELFEAANTPRAAPSLTASLITPNDERSQVAKPPVNTDMYMEAAGSSIAMGGLGAAAVQDIDWMVDQFSPVFAIAGAKTTAGFLGRAGAGYFTDRATKWVTNHYRVKLPARKHMRTCWDIAKQKRAEAGDRVGEEQRTWVRSETVEAHLALQRTAKWEDEIWNGEKLGYAFSKLEHYRKKIDKLLRELADDKKVAGDNFRFESCDHAMGYLDRYAYIMSNIMKMTYFVSYIEYAVEASQWVLEKLRDDVINDYLTPIKEQSLLKTYLRERFGGDTPSLDKSIGKLEGQLRTFCEMSQSVDAFLAGAGKLEVQNPSVQDAG